MLAHVDVEIGLEDLGAGVSACGKKL